MIVNLFKKKKENISFKRLLWGSDDSCSSAAQLCLTLCDPMDCPTPGFPILHHLLEFAQTQVHWVNDTIQPSHPLSTPSPPAFNLSQYQGLFQWVGSSHQVAKILELQLAQNRCSLSVSYLPFPFTFSATLFFLQPMLYGRKESGDVDEFKTCWNPRENGSKY